jgi:hypothetical protein
MAVESSRLRGYWHPFSGLQVAFSDSPQHVGADTAAVLQPAAFSQVG